MSRVSSRVGRSLAAITLATAASVGLSLAINAAPAATNS